MSLQIRQTTGTIRQATKLRLQALAEEHTRKRKYLSQLDKPMNNTHQLPLLLPRRFVSLCMTDSIPLVYMHPNHYLEITEELDEEDLQTILNICKYNHFPYLMTDPDVKNYRYQLELHRAYVDFIQKHPEEVISITDRELVDFLTKSDYSLYR